MLRFALTSLMIAALVFCAESQDATKLASLYSQAKIEKCLTKSKKFRKKAPESAVSWYYDFKCYTVKVSSSETPFTYRENIFNALLAAKQVKELDTNNDFYPEIQPELQIIAALAIQEESLLEKSGKTDKAKQLAEVRTLLNVQFSDSPPEVSNELMADENAEVIEDDVVINNTSSDHTNPNEIKDKLEEISEMLIGTPYRYGGSSPEGFDCSGFTSYVFSACAMQLPRNSTAQAKLGEEIKLNQAGRGDLLFFGTKNRISHVALVVSKRGEPLRIAHSTSSRGVTTHSENDQDWQHYWSKRFLYARRILD